MRVGQVGLGRGDGLEQSADSGVEMCSWGRVLGKGSMMGNGDTVGARSADAVRRQAVGMQSRISPKGGVTIHLHPA